MAADGIEQQEHQSANRWCKQIRSSLPIGSPMTDKEQHVESIDTRAHAEPAEPAAGPGDHQEGAPSPLTKPRSVSFNRDVHVKRIEAGAGAADVRRQPLNALSRQQLAAEASKVLRQAATTSCSPDAGPERFHSLPGRRRARRKSEDLGEEPAKRPGKSSLTRSQSDASGKKNKKPQRTSIFNLFKKEPEPQKRSIVKRSKSDVSDLKSGSTAVQRVRKRTGSESEEYLNSVQGKKTQLSPIIETNQSEDYFKTKKPETDPPQVLVTAATPTVEYKVNPIEKPPRTKEPKPPSRAKRSKTLTGEDEHFKKAKDSVRPFGTLPKSRVQKRLLVDEVAAKSKELNTKDVKRSIKETISLLESKLTFEKPAAMIHSSQKPPEKLPLTKGHTVDNMVKILNEDKFSPPPKSNILSPPGAAAHNNNQPFSYTKPSISPDPNLYIRSFSPDRAPSPVNRQEYGQGIIYAQVVCGNADNGGTKQTVQTAVGKQKAGQHSDEDEGLGYEESRIHTSRIDHADFAYSGTKIGDDPYRHLEDYLPEEDSPIKPRFKEFRSHNFAEKEFKYADEYPSDAVHNPVDYENARGRADGMDALRRESLAEPIIDDNMNYNQKKAELSYRRDLLESRINARKNRDHVSPGANTRLTPEQEFVEGTSKHVESSTRYYKEGEKTSGYTDKYISETRKNHDGTLNKTELRSRSKFNPQTSLFEPVLGEEMDRREFIDRRLAEEPKSEKFFTPPKNSRYFPPEPEYEPPSLDSQTSGQKYSPETRKYKPRAPRNVTSSHEGLHASKYSSSKSRQEKFSSGREHYASNPEIAQREGYEINREEYDPDKPETFHNSLRRQKHSSSDKHYKQTDYMEQSSSRSLRQHDSDARKDLGYGGETSGPESSRSRYENDRENKFADSGIENDYRKDSNGDIHSRGVISSAKELKSRGGRGDLKNESEDEGFASSLLIASERQHTEDNSPPVKNKYNSDYRQELSDYRRMGRRDEFIHRERSIDDGSFFDPRIDKFEKNPALNRINSKPPKATKKISSLEKVKQLFTRDSKKTKKEREPPQQQLAREEDLRRRYTEYRPRMRTDHDEDDSQSPDYDYSQRRRLATPSPSPSPPRRVNQEMERQRSSDRLERTKRESNLRDSSPTVRDAERSTRTSEIKESERLAHRESRESERSGTLRKNESPSAASSWFKSLDRLSKKKNKNLKMERDSTLTTTEEESNISPKRYNSTPKGPAKSLRFFGDTDLESNDSVSKQKSTLRKRSQLESTPEKTRTLTRTSKTLSSSVHALDRSEKPENKHRSSSLTNLQNGTQLDSRQNLLNNSYNKEKFSNGRRDLHNISEIYSNSETESQFEDGRKDRLKVESNTLSKPPASPFIEKRRSRSTSASKTTKTLRSGIGGSKGDLAGDDSRIGSDLNTSKHDLRSSRQELAGSRGELRSRRRRVQGTSPAESSTEGDSSHQSQRSIVYLHAATVGDIPGRSSRGKSRDDVSSVNSSHLQPHTKTVSRSFSVLAPWKPRHYREAYDINYSQTQQSTLKRQERPASKPPPKRESSFIFGKGKSASTKNLSKYDEERLNSNRTASSTLSRNSNAKNGSNNGTLARKSERIASKENLNQNIGTLSRSRNDLRKDYKKSLSTEVLSRDSPPKGMKRSSIERERISRSISMPKDPNKSAGWFKITKKSKKTENTNRLH